MALADDSLLHIERDNGPESVALKSRRSMLVFSSRPFNLMYGPARPTNHKSYTVFSLSLRPVARHELERRFEVCLFGDRKKVSALMKLARDEDRWRTLKDFVANDVFDCDELGLRIEHPRDFSWEGGGLFRSHSYDPHFLVGSGHQSAKGPLASCEIGGSSVSTEFVPKVFVSDGAGKFSERMGIRFPVLIDNTSSERIIHIPRGARLKVNFASNPGTVQFSSIRFERTTVFQLIAKTIASFLTGGYRDIPTIIRELPKGGTAQGAGPGSGGIVSKFWLVYRRFTKGRLVYDSPGAQEEPDLSSWLKRFQPDPYVIENYREEIQSLGSNIRFSLVCRLIQPRGRWLDEFVQSVVEQIYDDWELLLVDAAPSPGALHGSKGYPDPRIQYLPREPDSCFSSSLNDAIRRSRGDYILVVAPECVLEKHALYRFSTSARTEAADFLYSDETITGENTDEIIDVTARPAFSLDYYLSHPYFAYSTCIRREIAEKASLVDESLTIGSIVDFNLRCLEMAHVITHIPDYLYRRRTHDDGAGRAEQQDCTERALTAIERHLSRTGRDATVRATQQPDVFDVHDHLPRNSSVAIIIPTKNNHRLLRKAVSSCVEKKGNVEVEIFIIDHESDDENTRRYLASLQAQSIATVIPYAGPFNFSAMNNLAVSELPTRFSYYLFLNNDVEAISDGWIESMTATCSRTDVGVCGTLLLYPDDTIQHGGVTLGFRGAAEHMYKSRPYYDASGKPSTRHDCMLVARRDCMAVTAAAMIVRADVFHEAGGYDEQLPVGFNDTDLCLRILENGYKVILDPNVVLYHFESATRGARDSDPHPDDTERFRNKHRNWIEKNDLFYGAQLSFTSSAHVLKKDARSQFSRPRTLVQPQGCYGRRQIKL